MLVFLASWDSMALMCILLNRSLAPLTRKPLIAGVRRDKLKKRLLFLFPFTAVYLTGCCMFMPCHPGTWAFGSVTDFKGQPIEYATVSLYGSKQITNSEGCFNFSLADALPFTFTATATGYKSIEVPSKPGHYHVRVKLAPMDSSNSSEVIWKKISTEEYNEAKPCS